MNAVNPKESSPMPFSFIDVFFLLLAGLIVSFGIYFLAEGKSEEAGTRYRVELSSVERFELAHALPAPGEVLYGEAGEEMGEILSVETEEKAGGKILLRVWCSLQGSEPGLDEEILVETQSCVRKMRVDSVKEEGETEP